MDWKMAVENKKSRFDLQNVLLRLSSFFDRPTKSWMIWGISNKYVIVYIDALLYNIVVATEKQMRGCLLCLQ